MKLGELNYNNIDGFDLYIDQMSEEVFMGSYDLVIKPINGEDEVFLCAESGEEDFFFSLETDVYFEGNRVCFNDNGDSWTIQFFKKEIVDIKNN